MKSLRIAMLAAAVAVAPAWLSAAPVTFQVDPVHSFVIFKVRHMNVGNAYGEFNDFKGTLVYDAEAPEKSSLDLTIDVNSLDTKNAKRDEHVKSPDMLNAKQFPTITYKSTAVKKLDDTHFELTGDLTMHGVTKPVTAKLEKIGQATDPKGGERIGGETTFTIKRSDYGMPGMQGALGDDITITVAIEAIKQK